MIAATSRSRLYAAIPAALICAGAVATIGATAIDHLAYRHMSCGATAPTPLGAALCSSLAEAAAIAAFVAGLWPPARTLPGGQFRHPTLRTLLTVLAIVATVAAGALLGPHPANRIEPTAGPQWAIGLFAAFLVAATIRGCCELWWTRGSKDPAAWIVLAIGLLTSAFALGLIGYDYWRNPDALRAICRVG
jgi:hypothetical protein